MTNVVAVITPYFFGSSFIAVTVESVSAQLADCRVRHIVVDDSQDAHEHNQLKRLLRAHQREDLTLLRSTQNQGIAGARNAGAAAAADANYLLFLDQDDVLLPGAIANLLAALTDSRHVVVGSPCLYIDASDRVRGVSGQTSLNPDLELIRRGGLAPFAPCTALIRRSAFDGVGGFDESLPKAGGVDDLDLWARLAGVGSFAVLPEPQAKYRIHSSARSIKGAEQQARAAAFVTAKHSGGFDGTFSEFPLRLTRLQRARVAYRAAGTAGVEGDWLFALVTILRALSLHPRFAIMRLLQQVIASRRRRRRRVQ